MANIIDYCMWRGDLEFRSSPLCEVDSLIFSWISYIDFGGIVSPGAEKIPLHEAADRFFSTHDEDELMSQKTMIKTAYPLLKIMSKTNRFKDLNLLFYRDSYNETTIEQFSAITFELPDGSIYSSFRGTDGTVIGWKEDFLMSYKCPVTSQISAAAYFDEVARSCDGDLYAGGHSKGGNLAIYAALNLDTAYDSRLKGIYNHDGPGFFRSIVESENYVRISGRIHSIIPQSSVVGMILEHGEEYKVAVSSLKKIEQHDLFSWEILGNHVVTTDSVSKYSKKLDQLITSIVSTIPPEQTQTFVETIFAVLESTGIKMIADLSKANPEMILTVLKSFNSIDEETKTAIFKIIRVFIKLGTSTLIGKNTTPEKGAK